MDIRGWSARKQETRAASAAGGIRKVIRTSPAEPSPGDAPAGVPGLLQTGDYARAIFSARPDGNLEDLEEQVAARLARQAISGRTGAPSSGASSTKASSTAPSAAPRPCRASSTAWPR